MSVIGKAIASIFIGFVFTVSFFATLGGIGEKLIPSQKTVEEKLLEKYPDKNSQEYIEAKRDEDAKGLFPFLGLMLISPIIVYYIMSKFDSKK